MQTFLGSIELVSILHEGQYKYPQNEEFSATEKIAVG
jgi:hypothetical protein